MTMKNRLKLTKIENRSERSDIEQEFDDDVYQE